MYNLDYTAYNSAVANDLMLFNREPNQSTSSRHQSNNSFINIDNEEDVSVYNSPSPVPVNGMTNTSLSTNGSQSKVQSKNQNSTYDSAGRGSIQSNCENASLLQSNEYEVPSPIGQQSNMTNPIAQQQSMQLAAIQSLATSYQQEKETINIQFKTLVDQLYDGIDALVAAMSQSIYDFQVKTEKDFQQGLEHNMSLCNEECQLRDNLKKLNEGLERIFALIKE